MTRGPLDDLFGWLFSSWQPDPAAAPVQQTDVVDDYVPSWLNPKPTIQGETMGDYLKEQGLRVAHIHGDGYLRASGWHTTVVYEPRQSNKHTIRVATAVCGPRDTFSKKKGLELAMARWDAGQTTLLPPVGESDDIQTLKAYFE